ncbi:hypothetical protein [Streptacidiphilus jiangxiensis]|uniref:Uncharacterized protein n=1 Tax=Streptacidiphilus jiangxiensis TaxID=235985 RepID=A0A1H8BZH7_STRJI|nr:hypothetical protein [Streptacidiphilus jiangxiensis]SEM87554.1 hypothetical protein SAMN05414137_1892 [Streptacidiphilus jiangxiensis]
MFDPARAALANWVETCLLPPDEFDVIEDLADRIGATPAWSALASGESSSADLLSFLQSLGFCGPQASAQERDAWLEANGGPETGRTPTERALRTLHHDLVFNGGAVARPGGGHPYQVPDAGARVQALLVACGWPPRAQLFAG